MRIGIALVIAALSCGIAPAGDKCFSSVKAADAKMEQTEPAGPRAASDTVRPVTQEGGPETLCRPRGRSEKTLETPSATT
jgi:hypothetical protein